MFLRRTGRGVERDVLPLRPYMQPPRTQRNPDGTISRPCALLSPCQLMRWGQHPRRPQQHHHPQQQQQLAGGLPHSQRHLLRRGHSRRGSGISRGLLHRVPTHASAAGAAPGAAALALAAGAAQHGQRSQVHTLSLGGWGSSSGGRAVARPQLNAAAVRSTLLHGCSRLLGNLRMLRAF